MTFRSKLGSDNQTVLPREVVEALGAAPEGTLCFDVDEDGRVILSAKTASFAELADQFPKKKPPGKSASVAAMKQAVARGAKKRFLGSRK